jgi:hypothetical protein
VRPLSLSDRFLSWIVTGPVGRVLAFFADLAVYAWRSARGKQPGRGQR